MSEPPLQLFSIVQVRMSGLARAQRVPAGCRHLAILLEHGEDVGVPSVVVPLQRDDLHRRRTVRSVEFCLQGFCGCTDQRSEADQLVALTHMPDVVSRERQTQGRALRGAADGCVP